MADASVIRIWRHLDGSMSVLQADDPAELARAVAGRGDVYDVQVVGRRDRREAERTLALALKKEPDKDALPGPWLAWHGATKRVTKVTEVARG